jgi:hypothetical protein
MIVPKGITVFCFQLYRLLIRVTSTLSRLSAWHHTAEAVCPCAAGRRPDWAQVYTYVLDLFSSRKCSKPPPFTTYLLADHDLYLGRTLRSHSDMVFRKLREKSSTTTTHVQYVTR